MQQQQFKSLKWTSRVLAWGMAVSVVLLSVCPPADRPSTDVPHNLEHFLAFAITGLLFGFGYPNRYLVRTGALLLFTIGIEAAQVWIPGRHARFSDLMVNSLAVILGIWLAYTCYSIAGTRRIRRACGALPVERSSDHYCSQGSTE
jgi:VanZ family protein